MCYTNNTSSLQPERLAWVEPPFQRSRSAGPFTHTRTNSGDVAGAGDQFRPPQPQNSWPRQIEISPEDLDQDSPNPADSEVEDTTSTPRPHPNRPFGRFRGGSRSTPHLSSTFQQQQFSSEDVVAFIEQRDRHQHRFNQAERSSVASPESSTSASSPKMADDDDSSGAHTTTQINTAAINASRPSTPPPPSDASTENGDGAVQDGIESSPPWSSLKRKRTNSEDDTHKR